jgi:lysophospholipid acyltransferase (LPLAT)-like uncharacterized protein
MKEGPLNSLLLRLLPPALAWLMRLWFGTCRVTLHQGEHLFRPDERGKRMVASFWHYSMFYIFYFLRHYQATVMVSASRDGEYIARLAASFGFATARGSRNQRGAEGFRELLRAVRGGSSAALVADGSQGPPRVAQSGAIILAARTGVPILPVVWSASRYSVVRSWDRTAIPWPFSRIDVLYGRPIHVPAPLSPEDTERYRLQLENTLNRLYHEVWALHGRRDH